MDTCALERAEEKALRGSLPPVLVPDGGCKLGKATKMKAPKGRKGAKEKGKRERERQREAEREREREMEM